MSQLDQIERRLDRIEAKLDQHLDKIPRLEEQAKSAERGIRGIVSFGLAVLLGMISMFWTFLREGIWKI